MRVAPGFSRTWEAEAKPSGEITGVPDLIGHEGLLAGGSAERTLPARYDEMTVVVMRVCA
jgi:hypothetical protein